MHTLSTETAGICGLFCGTCPKYPEPCGGCLSDRVVDECLHCRHGFRDCAAEHEVTRCFECGGFPCARLEKFILIHVENGIVHHEHILDDLRAMKTIGVQAWVDRRAAENTCPMCGRLVHWHEKNLHRCGE